MVVATTRRRYGKRVVACGKRRMVVTVKERLPKLLWIGELRRRLDGRLRRMGSVAGEGSRGLGFGG
jgi:hypothetical protein